MVRQTGAQLCALDISDKRRICFAVRTANQGLTQRVLFSSGEML